MKITYLQTVPTRVGQRIPIQDVEDGEKFRVVSEKGQYLTGNHITLSTHPPEKCEKFKRREDHLYQLKPSRKKGFVWRKVCHGYFKDSITYPWMGALKRGTATIIVEIY